MNRPVEAQVSSDTHYPPTFPVVYEKVRRYIFFLPADTVVHHTHYFGLVSGSTGKQHNAMVPLASRF